MTTFKRPHPQKVYQAARDRGLFAMSSGSGRSFKYDFWDATTGKLVLSYYPDSGHWMAGQRDGNAPDYLAALAAGLGHARQPPFLAPSRRPAPESG